MLSSVGNDFLRDVEELLDRCDNLYYRFRSAPGELEGSLLGATSTVFAEFFGAQALEQFQRELPQLRFELITHLKDYSASSRLSTVLAWHAALPMAYRTVWLPYG